MMPGESGLKPLFGSLYGNKATGHNTDSTAFLLPQSIRGETTSFQVRSI